MPCRLRRRRETGESIRVRFVRSRRRAPAHPDGIIVSTRRFSGREVGPRDALHVGDRDVLEDVELAVGGLDVVVNDERRAPESGAFCWFDSRPRM